MGKRAIIIGAGPAGLTAAYELLLRTDIEPVHEKGFGAKDSSEATERRNTQVGYFSGPLHHRGICQRTTGGHSGRLPKTRK